MSNPLIASVGVYYVLLLVQHPVSASLSRTAHGRKDGLLSVRTSRIRYTAVRVSA